MGSLTLHCGMHALNALLMSARTHPLYTAKELDGINRDLHALEQAWCPDGQDTVPQAEGNWPVDVLLVALRRRGLSGQFVRAPRLLLRHGQSFTTCQAETLGTALWGSCSQPVITMLPWSDIISSGASWTMGVWRCRRTPPRGVSNTGVRDRR